MTSLIILFGRWLYNQPYLLLSLTSLFWAGNLIVGRAIAGHVPPIAISYMRWVGAFLLLLTISWPQLRRDWPAIRTGFVAWLDPANFDAEGRQKRTLEDCRANP